jgi:hypothetical protein
MSSRARREKCEEKVPTSACHPPCRPSRAAGAQPLACSSCARARSDGAGGAAARRRGGRAGLHVALGEEGKVEGRALRHGLQRM